MKPLSQSLSSNFCPELRKNALLISQSHFSNFALHMISREIPRFACARAQHVILGMLAATNTRKACYMG